MSSEDATQETFAAALCSQLQAREMDSLRAVELAALLQVQMRN